MAPDSERVLKSRQGLGGTQLRDTVEAEPREAPQGSFGGAGGILTSDDRKAGEED